MNQYLKNYVVKTLKGITKDIEADNCTFTEEQALDIMSVLGHQELSKTGACNYLNMYPGKFDKLLKKGVIPKGKKSKGFKELRWYKDELLRIIRRS